MRGSSLTKTIRLAWHLALQPQWSVQYLRDIRKSTIDLRVPWTSFAAIDRLKEIVSPGSKILELGAGGSTLFFLDLGADVVSTETSDEWIEVVENATDVEAKAHLSILKVTSEKAQDTSEYLDLITQTDLSSVDLVFIDCPDSGPDYSCRPKLFGYIEPFVKSGGMIMIDDSWRYPALLRENRAHRIETLRSVGPSRVGVTEAFLFYY